MDVLMSTEKKSVINDKSKTFFVSLQHIMLCTLKK